MKHRPTISDEIVLRLPCPKCGGDGSASVQERLVGSVLEWEVEFACSHCGNATASRSSGLLPEPYRRELLAVRGSHTIRAAPPINRAKALKALRSALGVTIEEAARRWQEAVDGRAKGTLVEMSFLRKALEAEGIGTEVERLPPEEGGGRSPTKTP